MALYEFRIIIIIIAHLGSGATSYTRLPRLICCSQYDIVLHYW